MGDKPVKTIIEVWGGEEPLQTSYGPLHYIMVRFQEDPDVKASVGCKPENVNKVRTALMRLLDTPAEFQLTLQNNGNYKITDYAGKHGSDCKVVGPAGLSQKSSSTVPGPAASIPADLLGILNELDTKLEQSHRVIMRTLDRMEVDLADILNIVDTRSAEQIIKDVLGGEEMDQPEGPGQSIAPEGEADTSPPDFFVEGEPIPIPTEPPED